MGNAGFSLELIRDFIKLQSDLFDAFMSQIDAGVSESGYVVLSRDLKEGSILLGEDEWIYNKHGAGVYFERKRDCIVIDNDRKFDKTDHFTEWRIQGYLESLNGNEMELRLVKKIFSDLLEKGQIEAVGGGLYRLDDD